MRYPCRFKIFVLALFFMFLSGIVFANNAPDFTLQSIGKESVSLSNYKGNNPVLLLFWTTWCPYCRDQLMAANRKYPELKKAGVELLAINVAESVGKVDKFVRLRNLNYPVVLDNNSSVSEAYSVMGVPFYVLIDKEGKILFKGNGFPEQEINSLIAK